ncbi:MAG: hypothetical protein HC887_12705, partial [Desulfobacteraceae bacterium]|nr:hypothetical protein [Desulfobacteraceae bacterium]
MLLAKNTANLDYVFASGNASFSGITVSMSLSAGWNLISLPVTPTDGNLTALFPEATVAYKIRRRI